MKLICESLLTWLVIPVFAFPYVAIPIIIGGEAGLLRWLNWSNRNRCVGDAIMMNLLGIVPAWLMMRHVSLSLGRFLPHQCTALVMLLILSVPIDGGILFLQGRQPWHKCWQTAVYANAITLLLLPLITLAYHVVQTN